MQQKMTNNTNKYIKKHVVERFQDVNYTPGTYDNEGLEAISSLKELISFEKNISYKPYDDRKKQRYKIITTEFREYFENKTLDVGTRSNILSELLGKKCQLVDKNNPDLPEFNWEKESLPYQGKSFDTVVCLDVLEHVDNLHEAFDDLLRVSSKYIIISLPNNWKKALNEFIKGRGRWASYGIPLEKPKDRHKWFFNTEDAEDFIYYHSATSLGNYEIKRVVYHIPKTILRIKITHPILKLFLPKRHFKNLFVETVFFVLEKKS